MTSRPVVRLAPLIAAVILAGAVLAARQVAPPPTLAVGSGGLVTVPAAAPGTVIRYTLDGTDPVRDSGPWLAPVAVPPGYQLKARAFTADGTPVGDIAIHDGPPTGA